MEFVELECASSTPPVELPGEGKYGAKMTFAAVAPFEGCDE
jgi:hypothetical protein